MRMKLSLCAVALAVLATAAPFAVVHGEERQAGRITGAEFDRLFTQVSNWGRWGKGDQRGAVNLITPEKRRQAAALVKSGVSASMQFFPLEAQGAERGDPGFSSVNALCSLSYNGKMYNGFVQQANAHPRCATTLGLASLTDGVFTRGVLMDMADVKGIQSLERGTAVTLQDVEAWERKSGVKVMPGDAVFLRTGSWSRRQTNGGGAPGTQHILAVAGFDRSVVPWLKSHDVAVLGTDVALDVRTRPLQGELTILDMPVRGLAVVGMGITVFDGQDLEGVAQIAKKLNRWEFLVTVAPLTVTAQSIPVNVIAVF